jgi:nucleoside-diphosphate-sugar epimerase
MVTIVVTGAAGFIGSSIVDELLARGDRVRGIDCFTDYYDEATKRSNLVGALMNPGFELVESDLRTARVDDLLDGADVVFHQAAQPGVRLSWESGFETYDSCNVLGTQRVLEAARKVGVERLVYASSSSVYGNAARYPVTEEDLPRPHSPYGVTKLAGEHLCNLYAANHGLSTISLRYFTVYGPRQRPDMAIHRLIESALDGKPFPLFGDGSHVRDFTYVQDVVAANLAAAHADVAPGLVVNVCAGGSTSMSELVEAVAEAVGEQLVIDRQPEQPGDVLKTGGDHGRALDQLGWRAASSLRTGIAAQVDWHRGRRSRGVPPTSA